MKKWNGFQSGVNLGGWLSQCEHTTEHYDTFITEDDIKTIAGWGLDHVRLPIDYELVQNNEGGLIESGFKYIDNCLEWCEKYGLNMILDLHKTAGYSFDEGEGESGFFQSEKLQERFIDLWRSIAERYCNIGDRLAFELLNEVVSESDNEVWMKVAEKTVSAIRAFAPTVKILIGGYCNNSITTIKYISEPFDENIIYNFHCYEPMLFTHQGAYWVKEMPTDYRLSYPLSKEEYVREMKAHPLPFMDPTFAVPEEGFTSEFFENIFKEALEIAEERNVMLYCGEYGVIDHSDPVSALAWYKDIRAVFEKYGIGRAAWNYKSKDFGIVENWSEFMQDAPVNYL